MRDQAGIGDGRGRRGAMAVAYVAIALTATLVLGAGRGQAHSTPSTLSWRIHRVTGAGAFAAVSCPSTSICLAITKHGALYSTGDAGAAKPAWKLTQGLKVTGTQEDFEQITGFNLSCPSVHLCVTSDESDIVTTHDPTGPASAWHRGNVQPPGLNADGNVDALDCPTTTLCVGALNLSSDESGGGTSLDFETSTDPVAGAGTFKATPSRHADFLTQLGCSPGGLCAGGDEYGDVLVAAHAAAGASAWRVVPHFNHELDYIVCPSNKLCLGVDQKGRLASSTTPGSTPWHVSGVGKGRFLYALSCASTGFCAGVGGDSKHFGAFTSTDPTKGSRWSYQSLPIGQSRLTSVSCRSRSFCVAVGEGGVVAVGKR